MKPLLFLVAIFIFSGCRLVLDTDECSTDADCEVFATSGFSASCEDNVCEVSIAGCVNDDDCSTGRVCVQDTCVDETTNNINNTNNVNNTNIDMGPDIDAETDMDETPREVVTGEIASDVVWNNDRIYVLDGIVTIENQASLTINAGTRIEGNRGSALVSKRGGRILATGTANEPIVFTSSQPVGMRASGDWGGVAMLGNAPTNQVDARLEGVVGELPYGGTAVDGNCGKLEYVRIEFAGFELSPNKELNGLTLGGCGTDTFISHVQIHYGKDDGLEIFGGTVGIDHIVISRAQDDSLDIDQGWQGQAQFIAILQDADGDFGIEASSSGEENTLPRTAPEIYNVTMVSVGDNQSGGLLLKDAIGGIYSNFVFLSFDAWAVDITSDESAGLTQLQPPELVVKESVFFDIGIDGRTYWPAPDTFDEGAYFEQPRWNNIFGIDPQIADPYDLISPDFKTTTPAVLNGAAAPEDTFGRDFIDTTATYYGAFDPNGPDWTDGWTSYPAN